MSTTSYLPPDVRAALDRLVAVAAVPTGQGRRVANFLLSWWNASDAGGFDLTEAWGLDTSLRDDVVAVFAHVVRAHHYPDAYGYRSAFDALWQQWRAGDDHPAETESSRA